MTGTAEDPRATLLSILAEFSYFFIITLSLNLETGQTGIPQFGRVLAVIAGAFAVGAIPGRIMAWAMGLPCGFEYGDDVVNYKIVPRMTEVLEANPALSIAFLVFCLLIAAVAGAAIGWLTSRPAIRLREAYLGISLLAFGDVMMWIGHNWEPLVGGSTGVFIPDPFRFTGEYRHVAAVLTMLGLAMVFFVALEFISRSPFGRTLRMHRDCELAAEVYGRDIVKVRTQSLVLGSAIAAMGGALYVIYVGSCKAISFDRATWTFWPWAYMMLGGIGNNVGVLFGVLIFVMARTFIMVRRYALRPYVPFDPIWLDMFLGGLVLVLIVLFMPHGLVPERPRTTLPHDKIEAMLKTIRERRAKEEKAE
ncbi:branched-chain amino acid ABC transporter permease [Candidatus Bathyarchaeota archaeon]|nr:MAG: branched-chain amino acid ABC transporter permease [Candidatus Bathyarchaeota archaeon]